MSDQSVISAECSYTSKYAVVKQSRMHYLEEGNGDPVLFVHGMPASSYLWRNIIPGLADSARCLAVDLIGMGHSDKPEIDYTVFEHIEYLTGFIKALDLKNVTLVLHGWGSVVGFEYARSHEKNIRAIAFFEPHVRAVTDWDMLSLPVQQLASLLNRPGASYRAIVEQNYLINKLLPNGVLRKLTAEELERYEEPFQTPDSRKPLWQYVQDLPLGNGETEVVKLINRYSDWLQFCDIPKLMMYAIPGFITTIDTVQWASGHLKNLTLVELQDALHFAQESIPEKFKAELRQWYLEKVVS